MLGSVKGVKSEYPKGEGEFRKWERGILKINKLKILIITKLNKIKISYDNYWRIELNDTIWYSMYTVHSLQAVSPQVLWPSWDPQTRHFPKAYSV